MREHMGLFRGKRIDNGEWVEGNLFENDNTQFPLFLIGYVVMSRSKYEGGLELNGFSLNEVHPDTIGECTELRDLRRDVLFEHDIVTAKFKSNGARCNFKIIFEAGSFLFDNGKVAVPFKEIRSAVKIGNVTDNPELLKGGEGE